MISLFIYENLKAQIKNRRSTYRPINCCVDISAASRGQRRSFSPPVHEKQTDTSRRCVDTRDDEVTRDSNIEATKMQKLSSDSAAKINQLQQTIDQAQKDRDYYKNEYNRLREHSTKNSEADNVRFRKTDEA